MSGGRSPALDGIRGIAVLLVVTFHYVRIAAPPGCTAARAFELAWSGVDLFFVLSGLLITGILLDYRDSPALLRVFYLRRACRILPVHLLLCSSFVAFELLVAPHTSAFTWLTAASFPRITYFTFTQNIAASLHDHFGSNWVAVTWSLAVEEQVYVVLPFVVILVRSRRALVGLFVLALFASPALRSLVSPFEAKVLTPMRADSFAVGALLALAIRDDGALAALRRGTRWIQGAFLVLLSGGVALTLRPDALGPLIYSWLAALYGALILLVLVAPSSWLARILSTPLLTRIGLVSYGIYMYHQVINGLLHGLVRGAAPSLGSWDAALVTLGSVLVTGAVSVLSWRFLEAWFLGFGRRFRYAPPPETPAGATQPAGA